MNPILSKLLGNQQNQNGSNSIYSANPEESRLSVDSILGMFNAVKNSSDPNAMLKSMAQSTPQVQQIMNMIDSQYNGDGQAAFYAKAKELGIDPDRVLNLFK